MFIWSAMLASSIVAIGDELVGGFTLDTNSHWMAERLRILGYPVKRVTQIRDRPQEIVVLPGVPLEMKGSFTEELEPQFLRAGSAATVRELRFTFAVEARFYPLMRELEEQFPDVSVGSYPNFETKELIIRCVGLDPKRVDAALDVIRKRAPV